MRRKNTQFVRSVVGNSHSQLEKITMKIIGYQFFILLNFSSWFLIMVSSSFLLIGLAI